MTSIQTTSLLASSSPFFSDPKGSLFKRRSGDVWNSKSLALFTSLAVAGTVLCLARVSYISEDVGVGVSGNVLSSLRRQELISNPPSMCINDPLLMPRSWRGDIYEEEIFHDSGEPWSKEEQIECDEAANRGLDELIGFFQNASDKRIEKLGVDAVNSLVDYVVGSSRQAPKFHKKVLKEAIRVLKITSRKYVRLEVDPEDYEYCDNDEAYRMMKLLGYAHDLSNYLSPKIDEELKLVRSKLLDNLQNTIFACGDLGNLLGDKYWREKIEDKSLDSGEVYVWNLSSIALAHCLTIPELSMPAETGEFVVKVWRYFYDYEIPSYADFEEERDNRSATGSWVDMAYLATHVAYIPTGYGRHYQYLKESPHLYHFCRENFYAAMQEGGHDLAAEFVDMLKIYGCTEENDIQVRHGVRYIMSLYKDAGNSFINHHEEGERVNDYNLVHKPWTGIAAVWHYDRKLSFEPEVPGSYGNTFRKAIQAVGYDSTSILADDVELP